MALLPQDFSRKLIKKEKRTEDDYSFYFERNNFEFTAGQYVKLMLDVEDPRGKSRTFSICSSPFEKEYLMITTKMSGSPFKNKLLNLSEGESVSFFGPMGRMVLNEEDTSPCIFLAGGIGITPFRSLLLYAAGKKISFPITFFVSFSTREEILFYDELSKISEQNSNIKIIYTITHSESVGSDWKGEAGRISNEMIKKYTQNTQSCRAYMAGPPAMVTAMQSLILELGIPQEKILKENFVGY